MEYRKMRYEGEVYRPPVEWNSYLLQCTIGCSYNGCTFCGMFKNKKFKVRLLEDILDDINMAKESVGNIKQIFLCDGDAIVMRQIDLITILDRLYDNFPMLEGVGLYAGPKSTLSKTPEQLMELQRHGLVRTYLGLESGSDEILKKINKGVDAQQMLEAGIRLREAGLELWAIILLGIAGSGEHSKNHAEATAEIINKIKPRAVSAMTYMCIDGTPMSDDIQAGRFKMQSPLEILEETKTLLKNITQGPIYFTSNHASNYLMLDGIIPEKSTEMILSIDHALSGSTEISHERRRGL